MYILVFKLLVGLNNNSIPMKLTQKTFKQVSMIVIAVLYMFLISNIAEINSKKLQLSSNGYDDSKSHNAPQRKQRGGFLKSIAKSVLDFLKTVEIEDDEEVKTLKRIMRKLRNEEAQKEQGDSKVKISASKAYEEIEKVTKMFNSALEKIKAKITKKQKNKQKKKESRR